MFGPFASRARVALLALGGYLLLYLSWQLWHWLPGPQRYGQAFLVLVDAAALCACVAAAQRCRRLLALRSFWLTMAAAMAAETVADALQLANDVRYAQPPYPSLADPFFLAFYVLLFAALLRVPMARLSARRRVTILLDGATIVIGGGAVIWYLVLGPTALEGNEDALATIVSLAYPLGDLILLCGLATLVLRDSPLALRHSLLWIALGVLAGIVADTIYGYQTLHGAYSDGSPTDTLYVLESACIAVAALIQAPVEQSALRELARPSPYVSLLPYAGLAAGIGLLIGIELPGPFFPDLSLVVIVAVLAALIAARQHLALRELSDTERELRASEQVKDEFVAVVGHELRTPLTSIRGSLGLLQAGLVGEVSGEAAQMLDVAVTNTDRLVRLINDVLDIERMDAGEMQLQIAPQRAVELVRQAAQIVQAAATQAKIQIEIDADERVVVAVDGDRVLQVLVNLLGNAIKFSERWTAVTVRVAARDGEALVSVLDTGRGIPPERLEDIFERFRQVDASDAREKGGSGLGLSIARAIVLAHGGRLWAESELGSGSAFRFTLPLAQPAMGALEPERSAVG